MKIKKSKKIFLVIFFIVLAFILISCKDNKINIILPIESTEENETTNDISEPETEENIDITEETDGETTEDLSEEDSTETTEKTVVNKEPKRYFNFLNGSECTRAEQRKRPVSITLGNSRDAMPLVGLGRADIIYECMVEGGITRLMMVLSDYDEAPVFGGVRSSREYFIDLSRSHDTIYVHAGGNEQDYWEFAKRPAIERIDGVNMSFPKTFYRDAQRRKTMALEHTLMTSGEGIIAGIEQAKYKKRLDADFKGPFNFYEIFTDIGGKDNTANYVLVPYSAGFKVEFIYNQDDSLYYRKQYGAAQIDGETGEQLRFENVIIIFAEYSPQRETAIQKREGHFKCELTGTGFGFYVSGGKYKIIRWSKETRESQMFLYNMDKSDLFINPGKSFICVTQTVYNKSVVINEDIKALN